MNQHTAPYREYLTDPARLSAIDATHVLETDVTTAFDRLTTLAAKLLNAPIALVSLVDHERHYIKSRVGLPPAWDDVHNIPLTHAFCQYVVSSKQPLIAGDTRHHPLLHTIQAIRDLDAIAYAGFPLSTSTGYVIGSLCVIDHQPRVWTTHELEMLQDLAAFAMTEIELRSEVRSRQDAEHALRAINEGLEQRIQERTEALEHVNARLARDLDKYVRAMQALEASELRFRSIAQSTNDAIIATDSVGTIITLNDGATRMFGYEQEDVIGQAITIIMPAHYRAAHMQGIARVVETGTTRLIGQTLELEGLRKDGTVFPIELSLSMWRTNDTYYFGAIVRDISERVQASAALRQSEMEYHNLFELANDAILIFRPDDEVVLDVNRRACTLYGLSRDAFIGRSLTSLSKNVAQGRQHIDQLLVAGTWEGVETTHYHADGSPLELLLNASMITFGGQPAILSINRDITARRRSERALRESESHLALAQRMAHLGSWTMQLGTKEMYWSDEMYRILGMEPRSIPPSNDAFFAAIQPDDHETVRRRFAVTETQTAAQVQYRIVRPDGTVRTVETQTTLSYDHTGQPDCLLGTMHDVTDQVILESQLVHQAFHDALTGLPNRIHFMQCLDEASARLVHDHKPLAVLFLDLDRFKVINDSLGHQSGDQLLVEVAARLRTCVRPNDMVARIGGDEFTILLDGIATVAEAERVAERVLDALRVPVIVRHRELFITSSIGITMLAPGERKEPEQLLREADMAMYRAKANGKAGYALFEPALNRQAVQRLDLETELRQALLRREFRVYYQPIVAFVSQSILEVEALVRWEHPQQGMISPAAFIPLAEETGMILPLGAFVLEEACRQVKHWQQTLLGAESLGLSVNLSARQFQHPNLVNDIDRILCRTGLHPRHLKLEITESVAMHDPASAIATMRALKDLGVHLAIDDFGTGYSSLAYLKRFPIDVLKIDRSFVVNLGQNPEDTAIVRAIVMLANTLHLTITAEGVETAEHVRYLDQLHCERGQGYFFARPLPVSDMQVMLAHSIMSFLSPNTEVLDIIGT